MSEEKKVIGVFKITLAGTVFEGGDIEVAVKGPLENKSLCYGILELAKDKVREYVPGEEPRIERITGFGNARKS
jgi:hypothetical protein